MSDRRPPATPYPTENTMHAPPNTPADDGPWAHGWDTAEPPPNTPADELTTWIGPEWPPTRAVAPAPTGAPVPCKKCRWGSAVPGNVVCSNCAIGILKSTCTHPWRPERVLLRTANGRLRPKLRCRRCYAPLGDRKIRDVDPSAADAYIVNEPTGACARCGRTDAIEVHHWAPRHLFPDADSWPTGRLCPECHRHWHVTTRTTGTSRPEPTCGITAERD